MNRLLALDDRSVYLVCEGPPAVYYIADQKAGGVLINAPAFSEGLWQELCACAPARYLFLPSALGARDLDLWRAAGIEVLAHPEEAAAIGPHHVDIAIGSQQKLTRTIGFLPMAGRTRGTCGLYLRNLPGALFLGPALSPGLTGWPELLPDPTDYSYESRLLGIFGLRDLSFEYVFTDTFLREQTAFGPGAGRAMRLYLDRLLTEA